MTPIHRRALLAAIAGLAANGPAAAAAPARIYLMRGLFDVFSLGMDRLASHLRAITGPDCYSSNLRAIASTNRITGDLGAKPSPDC